MGDGGRGDKTDEGSGHPRHPRGSEGSKTPFRGRRAVILLPIRPELSLHCGHEFGMRVLRVILFLTLAAVAWLAGALIPAYLRAVDLEVVRARGSAGPNLVHEAVGLIQKEALGLAELFHVAAASLDVPEHEELGRYLELYKRQHPEIARYGVAAAYLDPLFGEATNRSEPRVLDLMLPETARRRTLRMLQSSTRAGVQEVLDNRNLTNTTILPPVPSASGQALETAILLTALLDRTDMIPESLSQQIESYAGAANRGQGTEPIETFYLDVLALAQSLNWAQFTGMMALVDRAETLRDIVRRSGNNLTNLAQLYCASHLAGGAGGVARYLRQYPEEGMRHLRLALAAGSESVRELLRKPRPVHRARLRENLLSYLPLERPFGWMLRLTLALPLLALLLKCVLWLDAAFCLVRGVGWLLPHERTIESPRVARQFGLYQQQVLALLLVLLAVALTEPSLARAEPEKPAAPRWRIPVLSAAVGAKVNEAIKPVMKEINWIALVLFFVVQGSLYVLNLIKLREIKRQTVSSELKLRLLDNEEHMFDAGLYVGLGGTVLGLILPTFNVVQPSLMVAYASTLFGILFVSLLKICHVRPYRRSLILDSTLGNL